MALNQIKVVIAGIMVSAVLAIVGAGYVHYNGVLKDRESLRAQVGQLELAKAVQDGALEAQAEAIKEWQESRKALLERMQELQQVADQASAESRRLNALFSSGRFGRLSREKPSIVEDRVNNGTSRAIRMLECATGASGNDCSR